MTLKPRLVPCLDVRDGRVVKGVQFASLRDVGDPAELARAYALVASLDAEQRAQAVVADRRGRIEAGPGRAGTDTYPARRVCPRPS